MVQKMDNKNKCQLTIAVFFNQSSTDHLNNIHIAENEISCSNKAKYLGVSIDKKLSFNQHVKNQCYMH